MANFDFGFTLVDEDELDSAKAVASSSASASATQDKLDNYTILLHLYSITLRLILKKNILNGLIELTR
jgi:hypothetical protein